jgi:hypothetical protein
MLVGTASVESISESEKMLSGNSNAVKNDQDNAYISTHL